MRNYIEIALDPQMNTDSLLRAFLLHPLTREEKHNYPDESLCEAANKIIDTLQSVSIERMLDVIEKYQDEIQELTTASIPQFSELKDADRIPDIVLSNPDCKYKLIGYFFNKDAEEYSQQKYGENHYKLAAQIGLCEYADKKASDGITAVSFLGMVYKELPEEKRDELRPKLCLQIPFVQYILIKARQGEIDAMKELRSMLTLSTSIRRRSSIQQIMHAIEETMTTEKSIMSNIKWGYKKDDK